MRIFLMFLVLVSLADITSTKDIKTLGLASYHEGMNHLWSVEKEPSRELRPRSTFALILSTRRETERPRNIMENTEPQ